MIVDRDLIMHAFRRARVRTRVFQAIVKLDQASASEIAAVTGLDARRVRWALEGRPSKYRHEESLLTLALARKIRTDRGIAYVPGSHAAVAVEELAKAKEVAPLQTP
jgi:predicted transcriptional regulator with HTH domain